MKYTRNLLVFLIMMFIIGETLCYSSGTQYKKSSYFNGEIPVAWSEYDNGFGYTSEGISEDVIDQGGGSERYARYVSYSLSPHAICFSDVPEERMDIFKITPSLKDNLISKGQKIGTYAREKIGHRTFLTVTFANVQEGGIQKEYFFPAQKDSQDSTSFELIIQYFGDLSFSQNVQHFLSTLE